MRKLLVLLGIFTLLLSACKDKSQDDSLGFGDLKVKVVDAYYYSKPIEDVTVYTEPKKVAQKTNQLGETVFTSLEEGYYEVYISKEGFEPQKQNIQIFKNSLKNLEVELNSSVTEYITPKITFIFPPEDAQYIPGEEIYISAQISDYPKDFKELEVKWTSDLDGIINTDKPTSDGNLYFSTSSLTRGLHLLTLKVIDDDGVEAESSIIIKNLAPKQVNFISAIREADGIKLQWEASNDDYFSKYEIYRVVDNDNNGEIIATIEDRSIDFYVDETPPIANIVNYYVRVLNVEGVKNDGDPIAVEKPNGTVFNFIGTQVVLHPSQDKPYLYVVNKDNNQLIKYDYENDIILDVLENVNGAIGKIDIGTFNGETIIAVPTTTQIYVFNADTFEMISSFETGRVQYSVTFTNEMNLVVCLDGYNNTLRSYSINGALIDGWHITNIIREFNKMGPNNLFVTGSSIDNRFYKIRVKSDGTFDKDFDTQYWYKQSQENIEIVTSPDGLHFVTSNVANIYKFESEIEYVGRLNRGSFTFSSFAYNDNGSRIYGSIKDEKIIQIGDTNTLTRIGRLQTKGYPIIMKVIANKLIVYNRADMSQTKSNIEVIDLNN